MTNDQIELVQRTWRELEPWPDLTASVFYARLFVIDPATSALFAAADMRSQRQKLVLTLSEIVRGLNDTRQLEARLEELGRRHVSYGVRAEHYATVRTALLWMLAKMLGPEATKEVSDAWAEAYDFIAACMQRAPPSR